MDDRVGGGVEGHYVVEDGEEFVVFSEGVGRRRELGGCAYGERFGGWRGGEEREDV